MENKEIKRNDIIMEKEKAYVVVENMLFMEHDFYGVYPTTFDNYEAAKGFFDDRKEQITRLMLEDTRFKDNYEIFQEKCDNEEKYIIRERDNYLNSIGLVLRTSALFKENIFDGLTEEEKRNIR